MVKESKLYDLLGVSTTPLNKILIWHRDWLMLQVSSDASEAQLKTAYKKGALKYHPGPAYLLLPIFSF